MAYGNLDFGGFFVDGGTLGAGRWGIAGEDGPEVIHGPARITPIGGATVALSPSTSLSMVGGIGRREQIGREAARNIRHAQRYE